MNGRPVIEIKDVSKSFNGTKVLDGVNLRIERGETVVIIGRSGGGKSVLLKHMIGILTPDSGKVFVDGVDITTANLHGLNEVRKKFGMLFQGAALFDSMTVLENVGFGLYEHTSLSDVEIRKRVKEHLSVVGLEGIEEKKPAELSGGMRKRVGLARAIAMGPQIILYDEPPTGIDPIMGDIINELILKLRDHLSVTSVAVTHDMVSAYKIADRIAMLYDGRIVEGGTPDQIRHSSNPVVQQFITGSAHGPIKVLDE